MVTLYKIGVNLPRLIREKMPPALVPAPEERETTVEFCWGKKSNFEPWTFEEEEDGGLKYDDDCERARGYASKHIRQAFLEHYGCEESQSEKIYYDEVWRKWSEVKIMDTGSEVNYAIDHRVDQIEFTRREPEGTKSGEGFLGDTSIISRDNSSTDNEKTGIGKDKNVVFVYKHPALGEIVGEGSTGQGTDGEGESEDSGIPDVSPPPAINPPPTAA